MKRSGIAVAGLLASSMICEAAWAQNTLYVDPPTLEAAVGSTVTVRVNIRTGVPLEAAQLRLRVDPAVLSVKGYALAPEVRTLGPLNFSQAPRSEPGDALVLILLTEPALPAGDYVIASITYDVVGAGSTMAALSHAKLLDGTHTDVGGTPSGFTLRTVAPPGLPASLGQFKSDGTGLGIGGTTRGSVTFRAAVSDADPGDQVGLQVEARLIGTAFTGTLTASGALVSTGGTAGVTVSGFGRGSYHWQVRAVDSTGRTSAWVPFGGNLESVADFKIR